MTAFSCYQRLLLADSVSTKLDLKADLQHGCTAGRGALTPPLAKPGSGQKLTVGFQLHHCYSS